MAACKDQIFEDWWPLGQAMILVRAPIARVAQAAREEAQRLNEGSSRKRSVEWIRRSSLEHLFRSIERFSYGTSMHFYFPTRVGWTVAIDNSATCGAHDSHAYCLARFRKLETICFSSHDRTSTTLAGTTFTHYTPSANGEPIKRWIYCCNVGPRWVFKESGDRLPEEDLERYKAKRKRDRLNEEGLMQLLDRFGIQPWREATYEFQTMCFCMRDLRGLEDHESVTFQQIRERALGGGSPEEDREVKGPPDYLKTICKRAKRSGPAGLLVDGAWCGHAEETFWIYDICIDGDEVFSVRLPDGDGPPVVEATPKSGGSSRAIYDSRRHPAGCFIDSKMEPQFRAVEKCPKCASTQFRIAVGFEVPDDSDSSNDISWFALALGCAGCGESRIVYQDETH